MGLWTLAGSWCADHVNDGFVPDLVCARWDRSYRRLAARLIDAGLWSVAERDGEVGWLFHDWASYQPTRADKEAERADARERMKEVRRSQRVRANAETNTDRTGSEVQPDVPVSRPVPSVPIGTGGAPPPTRCRRHPDRNDDAPCRACGDARRDYDAWTIQRRNRPTPLPGPGDAPRCPMHDSEPAHNCRGCAADRKAAS